MQSAGHRLYYTTIRSKQCNGAILLTHTVPNHQIILVVQFAGLTLYHQPSDQSVVPPAQCCPNTTKDSFQPNSELGSNTARDITHTTNHHNLTYYNLHSLLLLIILRTSQIKHQETFLSSIPLQGKIERFFYSSFSDL